VPPPQFPSSKAVWARRQPPLGAAFGRHNQNIFLPQPLTVRTADFQRFRAISGHEYFPPRGGVPPPNPQPKCFFLPKDPAPTVSPALGIPAFASLAASAHRPPHSDEGRADQKPGRAVRHSPRRVSGRGPRTASRPQPFARRSPNISPLASSFSSSPSGRFGGKGGIFPVWLHTLALPSAHGKFLFPPCNLVPTPPCPPPPIGPQVRSHRFRSDWMPLVP